MRTKSKTMRIDDELAEMIREVSKLNDVSERRATKLIAKELKLNKLKPKFEVKF